MLCWLTFSLAPALGSIASASAYAALFGNIGATMARSDCPRLFTVGYCSRLPTTDRLRTLRSGASSPRFRRNPFMHDEVLYQFHNGVNRVLSGELGAGEPGLFLFAAA